MSRFAPHSAIVALGAAGILALAFAPEALLHVLEFDRDAISRGEPWRLWSGHLVHYSPAHALFDALLLLPAGVIAERLMGARAAWLGLLWVAPLISLGLLVSADLAVYRGLSGLASYLLVVAGVGIARAQPSMRPLLWLCAAVLALKTAGDALGVSSGSSPLPEGVRVEWRAHVLGAACAAAWCRSHAGERPIRPATGPENI